ncbi:carboxylate--amine ligase [Candidatus Accumulibacter phosphatis]|uniref:ATP-grasp enzyme-like protein n=1 Tax=Candidatus Accumulibacter phosphatis TaxID=327160 RepID=A0A5S4EQW7_9PROT|nr:carboxylate--amine ligase [Candidatus Accumulibacter phosphatis]TMQ77792.1 ATP-grasp enzyme-like protein [Candidatus Accumulibacter phosphatis]
MSAEPDYHPPCIVLGLETQIGLCIVRELGQAGVRVIGIAHDWGAIGLRSRYLTERLVVEEPRSDLLRQSIRAIGNRYGPCPLLAISEANLSWLDKHRGEFGQVFPVLPDAAAMSIVLDKRATLKAALAVGITPPASIQPEPGWQVSDLLEQCRLPAVLKWSDPNAAAPLLARHGLPLLKAEYAHTPEELLMALERYSPIGAWPIVQEYCKGYGLGQFFFMHQGKALQRFQHRRVAEWPPEGGFSSVCEGVPLSEHTELQARSIALLRSIGWEGVAMVEFRFDPETQEAKLMEVNGRFWGSFPLAYYSKAGFALLSYQLGAGLPLVDLATPRSDLRCRMVSTELKRLARIVLQRGEIADHAFLVRPWHELWRFIRDFFRSNVRYYVWSLDDPQPFIADLREMIGNTLRRS